MREIPAELLNKLMSQHQTKANNSDPRMSVTIARAKTTVMDTSYFTTETIRSKSGLGDISLAGRRLKAFGPPDRIYEIHVDTGVVKTATREYPDKLKDGWKDQFELGFGSSVAIAFDGNWVRYRKLWRLITSEKPFIFWVDDLGNLWSQYWDDASTKFQLATGVVKVKAIRAWKNASYIDKDQGIVVGFIKTDGSLNYRSYCQQFDGTYQWENEQLVTEFTGTAVSLNMFITNDYRMGFVVENNVGSIQWFITQRNWAGMASPDEYLKSSIKNIKFEVIPLTHTSYDQNDEYISTEILPWFNVAEPIYPFPINAENDDEYTIRLKFNYLIDNDVSLSASAFTIKDNSNIQFTINSIMPGIDNSEIVFIMSNITSASGDLFITYDRSLYELDCLNQGSRFGIDSFVFNFTPELTPPEGYDVENISISLPLTFIPKQVYYTYTKNSGDNISISISNIGFIVTKVGSNPL